MFTGFNLKIDEDFNEYYDIGKEKYDSNKKIVQGELDKYVGENGSLNGTKMQEDWFPQIDADIFISHSSKDTKLAICLAGWLYRRFGLTVFIDSYVWGYSNQLLKKIDEKYCLNEGSDSSYNYEKRNFSTSHVHMMLSTALSKMIDKTECIFLLNTSNSISTTKDVINNQTASPWIYSEIVATELVRKKKLSEYRNKEIIKKGMLYENASLNITYDVSLSHLVDIDGKAFKNWNKSKGIEDFPLDTLYAIVIPDVLK